MEVIYLKDNEKTYWRNYGKIFTSDVLKKASARIAELRKIMEAMGILANS